MATGYGLNGRGSIPDSGKIFLFSIIVQTVSGAHSASYPVDTTGCFPGSEVAEA
jgi:hypothetical protein